MLLQEQRELLGRLSTTNLSDALDALGLKGATYGINGVWEGCAKIYGNAVTVRLLPAGTEKPKVHLGIRAITAAEPGDVIVVDCAGRLDISCWGGVLATGASLKGISGVVIDGACRDVDEYAALQFPVYARGRVVATARGRALEESTNVPIQFGGVQVCPGDLIMADRSGVVAVPQAHIEAVLDKARQLWEKEERMCADLRAGLSSAEVDAKYSYEKMLKDDGRPV